jgi:lipase chaperone LimK
MAETMLTMRRIQTAGSVSQKAKQQWKRLLQTLPRRRLQRILRQSEDGVIIGNFTVVGAGN